MCCCGRRAAVLFAHGGGLVCRRCADVVNRSQRAGPRERAMRRARAVRFGLVATAICARLFLHDQPASVRRPTSGFDEQQRRPTLRGMTCCATRLLNCPGLDSTQRTLLIGVELRCSRTARDLPIHRAIEKRTFANVVERPGALIGQMRITVTRLAGSCRKLARC